MKHLLASAFALSLLTSPAFAADPAPSGDYVADPTHTSVTWRISHFGFSNYTARFAATQAALVWNAENPAASSVSVQIDPLSVRTDFPFPEAEDFDRVIGADPEYLAAAPITFISTGIELTGENTGRVTGNLTFREQTLPVVLDVTFNGSTAAHSHDDAPRIGFSGTATINRDLWGLDIHAPDVGTAVEVAIEIEFTTPPPQ